MSGLALAYDPCFHCDKEKCAMCELRMWRDGELMSVDARHSSKKRDRPDATRPPAYWRDAEADKPMRDGEFIVCSVCVQDCEFMRRVYLLKYDLTNGWDYVEDEVITHRLDNAPSLPEVVIK